MFCSETQFSSASHAAGFNFKRCILSLKQLLLSQPVSRLVTSVAQEAEAGRWQIQGELKLVSATQETLSLDSFGFCSLGRRLREKCTPAALQWEVPVHVVFAYSNMLRGS